MLSVFYYSGQHPEDATFRFLTFKTLKVMKGWVFFLDTDQLQSALDLVKALFK